MSNQIISDVLIIGGGPAGLSASLSLGRQMHTVVMFDSGSYRNDPQTYLHLVPTWDQRLVRDFREAAKKDFMKYDNVQLEDTEIVEIEKDGDVFRVTDKANKSWLGKKVILASGSVSVYPDIEGYEQCWGKGM